MIIHIIRVVFSVGIISVLYYFMKTEELEAYWRIMNTVPLITFLSSYAVNEFYLRDLTRKNQSLVWNLVIGYSSILLIAATLLIVNAIEVTELIYLVVLTSAQFVAGISHTNYLFYRGAKKTNILLIIEVVMLALVTLFFFGYGYKHLLTAHSIFYLGVAVIIHLLLDNKGVKIELIRPVGLPSIQAMLSLALVSLPVGILPIVLRELPLFSDLVDIEFFLRIVLFSWSLMNGVTLFFKEYVMKFERIIQKIMYTFVLCSIVCLILDNPLPSLSLLIIALFAWSQLNNARFIINGGIRDLLKGQIPLGLFVVILWLKSF